jgi:hypothetical protein
MLVAFPIVFIGAFLPLALMHTGEVRVGVITAAAVSGAWFDVLVVIIGSGAAPQMMGAMGESATAHDLRSLRRRGWHLVNGAMKTTRRDIDHIAVGPGGLLVVETKWSSDPWPINAPDTRNMDNRMRNAAEQANDNAKAALDWFRESDPDIPITSVAVFWTGARSESSMWRPYRDGKAVLVHGPDLRRWLEAELPSEGLTTAQVERAWSELVRRADAQDEKDKIAGVVAPPTMRGLAVEWVLKPVVGVVLAAYAFSLTRYASDWLVTALATIAGLLMGFVTLQRPPLRRFALGWTGTLAALLVGLIVSLVVGAFH